MILSIFYLVFLVAAGSNASPCKLPSGNGTSSSTTGGKAALHPANPGLNLYSPSRPSSTTASNPGPSNPPLGSTSGGSGTSGTSSNSSSLNPARGSCPQGFLNTVFNTNAGQSPGFPGTTWDTLTKHGIKEWCTFKLPGQKKPLHTY